MEGQIQCLPKRRFDRKKIDLYAGGAEQCLVARPISPGALADGNEIRGQPPMGGTRSRCQGGALPAFASPVAGAGRCPSKPLACTAKDIFVAMHKYS